MMSSGGLISFVQSRAPCSKTSTTIGVGSFCGHMPKVPIEALSGKVRSGFPKRSCSIKDLKRDDDRTRSHRALARRPLRRMAAERDCRARPESRRPRQLRGMTDRPHRSEAGRHLFAKRLDGLAFQLFGLQTIRQPTEIA